MFITTIGAALWRIQSMSLFMACSQGCPSRTSSHSDTQRIDVSTPGTSSNRIGGGIVRVWKVLSGRESSRLVAISQLWPQSEDLEDFEGLILGREKVLATKMFAVVKVKTQTRNSVWSLSSHNTSFPYQIYHSVIL
jgi:hypothetical protein